MQLLKKMPIAILIVSLISFFGCGDKETSFISIDEYITNNNLTVQETGSGLKYIIDEPGSAEKPTASSQVTVMYTGYRTDDFIFDSSNSATFPLNGVIEGWTEGIPLFGKGGSGTLFIPSELAYGPTQRSADIPPNTDLIFDIVLQDF